ncbi:MAG: hypothetical protein ACUVQU_06855, partial [Candidatus Bipolaricaulia bacterium]
MTLRIAGILTLCLLAGSVFLGASTAGPPAPPPPTPPPPEPEPTPPPEVYPCILEAPLPPEIITLRVKLPFEPADIDSWIKAEPLYESGPFKTFINPKFQGINALLNFSELQQGAYIGLLQAAVPFRFEFKGGERCPAPPVGAARSMDDGSYLLSMANAPTLGIKIPPELMMNWFVALVRVKIPFEPADIGAIIFYPDARYRSPEEMLKAARSLDDGGIL